MGAEVNDDVFAKLPLDIILQILTKLPAIALIQLRCVSKPLYSLISHPHFINLHLAAPAPAAHRHHLVYYEPTDNAESNFSFLAEHTFALCKTLDAPYKSIHGYIRLVGSCRGILCLFDTSYFTFAGYFTLWNPFIRRFKIVPSVQELSCVAGISFSHMGVGFGFNRKINDFRVVKILYYDAPSEPDFVPKTFVYDLKVGSWRMIAGPSVPCFLAKSWTNNVFVNGVVHWLAHKRPKFIGQPSRVMGFSLTINSQPNCVMGFDLAEEVFTLIELPENIGLNALNLRLSPSVDEKSLALFVSYRENTSKVWDFWVMTDYNGNVESWKRVSTIVLDQEFYPIKVVNGGQILASTSDTKLVLVDVEKDEVKDLEVCGYPASFYGDGYVPSLALLCN